MKTLIKDILIINEGKEFTGSVLIGDNKIEKVYKEQISKQDLDACNLINGKGKYLMPGIIDTHVHFRDLELSLKGDFYTESKAGVAGGVTSYIDMPNTVPPTISLNELKQKNKIASEKSLSNYAFYVGLTDNNLDEIMKLSPKEVPGIKIFMGTSTGNLAVKNEDVLNEAFKQKKFKVLTHCEDDDLIKNNIERFEVGFEDKEIPAKYHSDIRNEIVCFNSTSKAVKLASKHGTKLHLLHLTTEKELQFLKAGADVKAKNITSEVTVNHLWYNDDDYEEYGNLIKCNPSIKSERNRIALLNSIKNDTIDLIVTDHAPHSYDDKQMTYLNALSGIPSISHSLNMMLEFNKKKELKLTTIADKMAHNPAKIFNIEKRGFVKEGYFADLVIIDPEKETKVEKNNLHYKCNWSPFEEKSFNSKITHTFVNGELVYKNGKFNDSVRGSQLKFKE